MFCLSDLMVENTAEIGFHSELADESIEGDTA